MQPDNFLSMQSPKRLSFLLAETAPAASVHDPGHNQAIHRRDHRHGQNYQPYAGSEGDLRHSCDNNQLQEGAENVQG